MALSDLVVRQAKTTGKRYTLYDNDCLSLMVSAAGGKSWIFRYSWLGKQKRMSVGGYPALSLREARAERDKAQVLLARGIDPQIERDQRRHAARLAGEYTFKNVFDAWVEHRRKELKEGRQSTLSQILRIFNKDVLPTLGRMSIYDIRRPQLVGVVAAIEKRKAFTTAEKVRTWFNQMFRYALVIAEGLEVNPAADLDVVAEPKPPVAHNPYLHLPELPEFLQKLRRYNPRGWQTQLGVRLLFLTGVRTGELRLAEPEQFDLDRGLWIIPPQVVKQLQDEMRKAGMPRVPGAAIGQLDVQIHCYLADVVQQCRVGDGGGPGLGLRGLVFGVGTDGQQMGLPQLQAVGDDFEAMVEHAARVGVVVRLGGRKRLDQLGVALQWRAVQGGELPARQRRALPDVFQQLLPARRGQQRCGRLWPHQPFWEVGDGWCRWSDSDQGPFSLEQGEHVGVLMAGRAGGLFAFSR